MSPVRLEGQAAARTCVLLAAVLWSSSAVFAKSTMFDDWPTSERGLLLAFWRALFAGLLLLPMVRRPRWRRLQIPMGFCFAGMNITYLTAFTLTTAANAIWLQNTAPLWVFLIGVVVLKEKFERRELVPLVLAAVGIGTILAFELQSAQGAAGVMYGLSAGVCYACVVLGFRALRKENTAWLVTVNHLMASLLMLPWVIAIGRWPTPMQLAMLATFGIVQMGLPYVLFAYGLRHLSGTEASLIALLEPCLVPIWAWLVWGEATQPWTIAGAGCILAGLLLRFLRRPPQAPPPA